MAGSRLRFTKARLGARFARGMGVEEAVASFMQAAAHMLRRLLPSSFPRLSAAGAFVAVLLVLLSTSYRARAADSDDQQLRDEVLECEDAYARLEACCPAFVAPNLRCQYDYSSGCGVTSTTTPGISQSEATCIRGMSCAELVQAKVCSRAASLSDRRTTTDSTTDAGGGGDRPSLSSSSTSGSTSSSTSSTPAKAVCP